MSIQNKENNESGKANISYNLKQARKDARLTKAELARRIGIPYTTYDSYERGDRVPSHERIRIIARELSVDWWALMGFSSFEEWAYDTSERGKINLSDKQDKDIEQQLADISSFLLWDDLQEAYSRLNEQGKQEAVKRVQELGELSKYRF